MASIPTVTLEELTAAAEVLAKNPPYAKAEAAMQIALRALEIAEGNMTRQAELRPGFLLLSRIEGSWGNAPEDVQQRGSFRQRIEWMLQ